MDNDISGAIFSTCRKHRYVLWRKWNKDLYNVMFIGLNHSSASENNNDNTIIKVSAIAKHNGYGGIYMLNLFSYISTDQNELIICKDNSINDDYLKRFSSISQRVVFCWGAFKQAKERAEEIKLKFPSAYCLRQNNDGSPKHPLYCLDKTIIKPYNIFV